MSFAGFVIFVILPVAPPWLAAHRHLLPGVRSLIAFAWSGAVWFGVVYLGQHYGTDVIGGIVFAAGTWLVMTKVLAPRVPSLQRRPVRGRDPDGPGQTEPAEEEAAASR